VGPNLSATRRQLGASQGGRVNLIMDIGGGMMEDDFEPTEHDAVLAALDQLSDVVTGTEVRSSALRNMRTHRARARKPHPVIAGSDAE
jgi:hypothetical protein